MFPTLSHLVEYFFRVKVVLPIQTLGFFIAVSFIVTYFVFKSEFKRREKIGVFKPYTIQEVVGGPASALELLVNGLLGFIAGYKILGILFYLSDFTSDPRGFIFSLKGNLLTGILCGAGLAYWAYSDRRKELRKKPVVVDKLVHPYELMPLIVFSVGFWGFIGAKLFDCLENWHFFIQDPFGHLFSFNGFTYYGGLVFGALSYLYIGYNRGMKLIHLADNGSPGMMLAYGVGRIGCQLSGDGDWGIVNTNPKPGWLGWLPDWAWSYTYPHNVLNEGVPIKNCIGEYCNQLAQGVYPTPLYEATLCILLFGFLWAIRKYIRTGGIMFCIFLLLNGAERMWMESIRINPKYHFLGMAFTQAELICFFMILGGTIGLVVIAYQRRLFGNIKPKAT
ncbi:diacylglyceryl transferase [Mucilaginibacter hurinus]|uniref:Diacylglyceryl transferase n=1 Tax=Mucilaginibacter hurinus TaxID=2201324 RepID=A0A367GQ25_9SPHI|nr:prolipoprotein diacylglyceryl transferase family protein [Mucilaginibacter hurinus]RCH55185.1 diacylglyceryl transferase [Mucilaginibacter hurinus]